MAGCCPRSYRQPPVGKKCILGSVQILPPGRSARNSFRPEGKFCTPARLQANSARLLRARIARLMSAEIARDSYDYLINDFPYRIGIKIIFIPSGAAVVNNGKAALAAVRPEGDLRRCGALFFRAYFPFVIRVFLPPDPD